MNRHATHPDVDDIAFKPREHYTRPADVLADRKLKDADKLRVLQSWKLDAQRLADSATENMNGGEESDLRDVAKALNELEEKMHTQGA